ncbi:MAG: hypothetical protein GF408_04140 [Candidatus Omnitrophica bacterium]|nr:hypothetical protein [Candidatus Omnitrophota bacterium]
MMSSKAIKIITAVLAVFVLLVFTKNTIVKISVEKGVQAVTGLKLGIKSLDVGLVKTLVDVKGLRLYNPPAFRDKLMMDVPEIYVDYDLPAIMKGTIHLSEMRLDLKEFVVVKNEEGVLNLDSLKVVQEEVEDQKAPAREKAGEMPEIQIDSLRLKIGKVVYKDYSKGGEPSVKEFNISLDETYKNIDDPNKLVSLIVVRALMNTTISNLANFNIGPLKDLSSETLATAQKMMGKMGETGGQILQQAAPAAETATQTAGDAVSSTADAIGGALGGIFGDPSGDQEK